MPLIPISIPRSVGSDRFNLDPLAFLEQARAANGDLFVVRDNEPVFSRTMDCAGAIAVFGDPNLRLILGDIETYGLPDSAARHLNLPDNLANLTRSLHTMNGEQHACQKRLISQLLNSDSLYTEVGHAIEGCDLIDGEIAHTRILQQMRTLTLSIAARILFGTAYVDHFGAVSLLHSYFTLRQAASSAKEASRGLSDQLVMVGNEADNALRTYVRRCRHNCAYDGLVAALANQTEYPLSEDLVVSHSNILLVSITEPIAIALSWIIIVLSQLPVLREELRGECKAIPISSRSCTTNTVSQLSGLDHVVRETLRLLPPNALMVRVTKREVELNQHPLPPRTELIICPFVSHRDGLVYEHPNKFDPARWRRLKPSPYSYLPFGAGGHVCAGANLALHVIKTAIVFLITRYHIVLHGDQSVDWRSHILFSPSIDPRVVITSANRPCPPAGKLLGPVANLIGFDT